MTVSITWAEAQDLIADECALALGWDRTQITWDTEAEQVSDDLVRLGLVSSLDQRTVSAILDASQIETRNYVTQGVVQIRVETTDPGDSITDCGKLKRWFSKRQTRDNLAELGLGVMREPDAIRTVPINFDGFWVSVSQFEITIDFNTTETDTESYLFVANRVTGTGTVNDTIPVPVDVTKP